LPTVAGLPPDVVLDDPNPEVTIVAPTSSRSEAADAGDTDGLGAYLREIGRFALLTAEQEIELAQRIEAGEEARVKLEASPRHRVANQRARSDGDRARRQMIEANLRLVVSIARRHRWSGVPLLDLIQEGNIGLMRGVDKYQWRKGFKFSTYATWWIRQAIQRGIADRGRSIRLPVHVHELLGQIARARREAELRAGRAPTNEEIAELINVPAEQVNKLSNIALEPLSLQAPWGEEGTATLGDRVPDDQAADRFDAVLTDVARETLMAVLSKLNERERVIVAWRFGLTGEDPLTLEQIGRRFGLTRERIRQLEARALTKLRHPSLSAVLAVDLP
jgi:RNA polymerase primary sigma factor